MSPSVRRELLTRSDPTDASIARTGSSLASMKWKIRGKRQGKPIGILGAPDLLGKALFDTAEHEVTSKSGFIIS